MNSEYIDSRTELSAVSYKHYVVTPDCIEIPLAPLVEGDVIGSAPDYSVDYFVDDINTISTSLSVIEEANIVDTVSTTDYNVSIFGCQIEGDGGNTANSTTATITLTVSDLNGLGFKGTPSVSYFTNQASAGNFFWVDKSELITGITLDTVTSSDYGSVSSFAVSYNEDTIYPNNSQFVFSFLNQSGDVVLDLTDDDVYFKQIGLSEYVFTYSEMLNESNVYIKNADGMFITDGWTLEDLGGNSYKLTFWDITEISSTITVYHSSNNSQIEDCFVKVVAEFDISSVTHIESQRYSVAETYIYDKYLTDQGYLDNSKVKILSLDSLGNPQGVLNIFKYDTLASYIILETYTENNIQYERVSKIAVAASDDETLPNTALVWYDTTSGTWKRYVSNSGTWLELVPEIEYSPTHIYYGYTEYRVVEGRSHVDDTFMSFRWDHYADANKRIDPSTSNIIDLYLLTTDYVISVNQWIANNFKTAMPTPPNSYELKKLMQPILDKASISDHLSFIPAKFKFLFGDNAATQNQAIFKVIKRNGTSYTDSEIKTAVSTKVNEYFKLENWDFGDTFYYSELAAYLHTELKDYLASVIITPKYATGDFRELLSITCEPNEIFLSITTSKDVKIISSIATTELIGE